ADAETRSVLRYWPNSSLYKAGGRWRLCARQAVRMGEAASYSLRTISATDDVDEAVRAATNGATLHELASRLVATDPEGLIAAGEARAFILRLIEAQVLTSRMSPTMTGRTQIADFVDQLPKTSLGQRAALRLQEATRRLEQYEFDLPGA